VKELPINAQTAPVNGIVTTDVNQDGNLDILMIGNDYGNEVFMGRYDAFNGLVLTGDGTGKFEVIKPNAGGLKVEGNGKALAKLSTPKGEIFIATQNRDTLKMFMRNRTEAMSVFRPSPEDVWAELTFQDGKKQKVEFYWGSGYLSQSTRTLSIHPTVISFVVFDSTGKSRLIKGISGL
jgi:hypothetical protein